MAAFMLQTRIFTEFHVVVTGRRHFEHVESKLSVETREGTFICHLLMG
jgi:hypothetical protein